MADLLGELRVGAVVVARAREVGLLVAVALHVLAFEVQGLVDEPVTAVDPRLLGADLGLPWRPHGPAGIVDRRLAELVDVGLGRLVRRTAALLGAHLAPLGKARGELHVLLLVLLQPTVALGDDVGLDALQADGLSGFRGARDELREAEPHGHTCAG